ncbi:helix-turn-helix domain-containing protein [Consotaella aegiceratis]|uniref:helix-turn-helix domain-containing protein n=1 Tax=Consotaella aegiceratis TaxID=3097961 RepID=UPI002F42BB9F
MLDIGELSAQAGIPPSTLRYYEDVGLIRSVARHGLRRQYDPDVLLRLSLIQLGKSAGFTLSEIAAMVGQDGQLDLPRADLHAKADAIERQIGNLQVLRDMLRHVADCPAPSHLECPSFRKLIKVAGRVRPSDGQPPATENDAPFGPRRRARPGQGRKRR